MVDFQTLNLQQNMSLSNRGAKGMPSLPCSVKLPNFKQELTSFELYTLGITSFLNTITIVPAIAGNFFILLFLSWKPQLRSNSHVILGCLATTDILVGMIVQPLLVTVNVQFLTSNISTDLCEIYVVHDTVKYACGICSSCVSILVTADRSLAVGRPYVYEVKVTKTRVAVMCVLTWILSITLTVLRRIFSSDGRTFAILFIVVLSIAFIVVAVLYVQMLRIANRHRVEINTQDRLAVKQHCRERKALKTVIIIIGIYFLCYLPYIVGRVYFVNVKVTRNFRYVVMLWPKTLLYVNSSLNPIILFWKTKKMRKALWELLYSIICRRGRSRTVSDATFSMNRFNT